MLRISCLALIAVALQACSSSQTSDSNDERAFPAAAARDLDHALQEVVSAQIAPGVSAVVKRPGYAMWSGTAGVADRETMAQVTPSQRFRAGSMLKVAVATAVLQLVERKQLALDDTLGAHLPAELVARIASADRITVRMLLSHTSGIPDFADEAFDGLVAADPVHVWSLAELYDRALANPPLFTPGSSWSYSNTNYVLLGQIIERVSGKPWRQVVRDNVFARAGLANSSLPEEGNRSCDGCARGYESIEGTLVDLTEVDPSMAGAAGGEAWITTPSDVSKLVSAIAHGDMFDDPSTLDLMLSFTDAPVPQETQIGYGFGIARFRLEGVELIGHLGGTAGFQSFVFYDPSSGTSVSGYMNCRGDFGGFVLPFMNAVKRAIAAK